MCTNKHAFTLIELLVVVLIIGILAAIALPQYEKAVKRSRGAQMITMTRSLADAANRYYLANNTYEGMSISNLDVEFPASVKLGNETLEPTVHAWHNTGTYICMTTMSDDHKNCFYPFSYRYQLENGQIKNIVCVDSSSMKCRDYFAKGSYACYGSGQISDCD